MLILQIVGLLLLAAPAFAQQSLATSAGSAPTPKAWSLSTSLARSNSLYVTGDGKDSASWDLAIAPGYKLNKDYTLSALVEASHDLKAEESDYGRGIIGLKKSSGFQALNKRIKLIPGMNLSFPLSKAAKATSLQVGVAASGRIEANSDFLISKRLGLAADLSVKRNFHEYDTAYDGTVNTKWSASEGIEVSWSFTEAISLTASLTHFDTLSYQGVARDYLAHGQELAYQATSALAFAVGHAWGVPYATSRKANGQDINLNLTDDRNSLVYAQMSLSL
jgi:hypothetical protein